MLFRAVAHDAFPENRRAWLDQLKQADPENALAYYLSANQHWKDNDLGSALQDLAQAAQKTGFQDYITDHMQSLEEIYLNAGRTAAEAKALATHAVEMPHISQLSEMSKGMADLMKQYQNNGDSASVENLARMGLSLGSPERGAGWRKPFRPDRWRESRAENSRTTRSKPALCVSRGNGSRTIDRHR